MNIIVSDSTGSVATRSYSDMLIIGEDGTKTKTFEPRGVNVTTVATNITIDGISQFDGLVNESKWLMNPRH